MRLIHIGIIAVITSLIGCGSGDDFVNPVSVNPTTNVSNTQLPKNSVATIRDGLIRIVAYEAPRNDSKVNSTFPSKNKYGSSATFLVVHREGNWIKVVLPVRPYNTQAWVSAADITVTQVASNIKIDISEHSMVIFARGKTTTHRVGVGSRQYPTPEGMFFVTDRLNILSGKAYGSFALGLSARSNVLTEFNGGDAQIGIHGTNISSSIGQNQSHGCIRVSNDPITMSRLKDVGLGTVVYIVK